MQSYFRIKQQTHTASRAAGVATSAVSLFAGLSNLYFLLSTREPQLPPATKRPCIEAASKLSSMMQKIVLRCF